MNIVYTCNKLLVCEINSIDVQYFKIEVCLSNNIGSLKALKIISLLIIRKAAYYWLILSLFRRGKFVKLETTI